MHNAVRRKRYTMLIDRYYETIDQLYAKIKETQRENEIQAGKLIAESVKNGGCVHIFDTAAHNSCGAAPLSLAPPPTPSVECGQRAFICCWRPRRPPAAGGWSSQTNSQAADFAYRLVLGRHPDRHDLCWENYFRHCRGDGGQVEGDLPGAVQSADMGDQAAAPSTQAASMSSWSMPASAAM